MTAVPVDLEPAAKVVARALRRRRARRRFTARKLTVAGAFGVVVAVVVAVLAPLISPFDPDAPNFDAVLAGPFHPRCPVADLPRCRAEVPVPVEVGGGRTVSCHLVRPDGKAPDLLAAGTP